MGEKLVLDTEVCELLLGDFEPIEISGDQDTIGTAALYEADYRLPDAVAAVVIMTKDGGYYGESFTSCDDAGLAWIAYEDAFTLERDEPEIEDLVFYQEDEDFFYLVPHNLRFPSIVTLEKFLKRHLYPKGVDKTQGREVWFYDAAVGNYHRWPVAVEREKR